MKKSILISVFLMTIAAVWGQDKKIVYKLDIKQEITKATWRQVKQAFEEADSVQADLVLIHMNTYGGLVVDADSIRTKILEYPKPVIVFIDNNAASAGALICLACDSIYMRPGSSFGAATVVNQTGQAMPDKYQSYMRSTMRATAEAHGKDTIITGTDTIVKWRRDPLIAEAMVDPRIFIAGVVDTGKVLTFTPSEAMQNGYCEGLAENIPEVLKNLKVENYEIKEYKPTWLERIIGFLVNPIVSGILIMAIIGGIYFELQSPGIGFPLGLAVFAAILYFAPLYLEGLAANWEILIFVVGLILIALEIFVIPGFGVTGIAGITLAIAGLALSLLNNIDFDFSPVKFQQISLAFLTVLIASSAGLVGAYFLSRKMFTANTGPFRHLSLKTVQDVGEGFVSVETQMFSLKGKKGVASTMLRPSGKVTIEGEMYDAKAENGYVEKGEKVIVTRVEAAQVYVEKEG